MLVQELPRYFSCKVIAADYILQGASLIGDARGPEVERLKENLLGPLSTCNVEQLKCMEQIARYYVEGIVDRGK